MWVLMINIWEGRVSVGYIYLSDLCQACGVSHSQPVVTSCCNQSSPACLPNTTQSLQTNMMANISPRAKLNYDSDTFSLDFNVDDYSPEVDIEYRYIN